MAPDGTIVGKRLVKSPKTYIRDSGILHALLGIGDLDALLGHPVAGASWEGLVIENLLAVAPPGTEAFFYRTSAGAEIDSPATSFPVSSRMPAAMQRTPSSSSSLSRA